MTKHAMKIWEVSLAVDCQTMIVKCGYTAKKKKLWSENNGISCWLYLNQQGTLVKEIFRNSELLEFCHLERYEWCKVNFCIPLFSVLLTRRSCNGGALLFRHRRNQRNIRVVSVRLQLTILLLSFFPEKVSVCEAISFGLI